jgi:polyisoprenoid-binding protein YceI
MQIQIERPGPPVHDAACSKRVETIRAAPNPATRGAVRSPRPKISDRTTQRSLRGANVRDQTRSFALNRYLLILASLLWIIALGPQAEAAQHYLLEGSGSRVGFSTDFGPSRITGSFPVAAADLRLDFGDLSKSSVSVTLDVGSSAASFPFASQAMKGPKVLDSRHYPRIEFRSTRVSGSTRGAIIDGKLTIRGVTRPVSLKAALARAAGTDPSDLEHLVIRLTGSISRSAFGASGWPEAVGDVVRLEIVARIARVD